MVKKFGMMPIIIITIISIFMLASCAKKDIQTGQATIDGEDGALDSEIVENNDQFGDIRGDNELSEEQLAAQKRAEEAKIVKDDFVNENIYFGFDSATLTPEAQEILKKKFSWLEQNPEVIIVIEGHCDNRGTEAYNLALGERRAESAKAFLADLGIDEKRIMTISYGEERPIDPGETEDSWILNRRAAFVIQ